MYFDITNSHYDKLFAQSPEVRYNNVWLYYKYRVCCFFISITKLSCPPTSSTWSFHHTAPWEPSPTIRFRILPPWNSLSSWMGLGGRPCGMQHPSRLKNIGLDYCGFSAKQGRRWRDVGLQPGFYGSNEDLVKALNDRCTTMQEWVSNLCITTSIRK